MRTVQVIFSQRFFCSESCPNVDIHRDQNSNSTVFQRERCKLVALVDYIISVLSEANWSWILKFGMLKLHASQRILRPGHTLGD
jgi:hypothetical protein